MSIANYESTKQKIEAHIYIHHSKLDINGYWTPLLSHTNSIIIFKQKAIGPALYIKPKRATHSTNHITSVQRNKVRGGKAIGYSTG
jgi:hypothetical protein